jgi:hypothetical protein
MEGHDHRAGPAFRKQMEFVSGVKEAEIVSTGCFQRGGRGHQTLGGATHKAATDEGGEISKRGRHSRSSSCATFGRGTGGGG